MSSSQSTKLQGQEKPKEGALDLRKEMEGLHPASFTWAMNCCKFNRAEAQDVLQTTYLKVLDGRAQFDGRSSFKTWLFSVIRLTASENRKVRFLRDLSFKKWLDGGDEKWVNPETFVPKDTEPGKTPAELLNGLPEKQARVMELVFFHDLTLQETATIMGVSVGTVRQHYERGKNALRLKLGKKPRGIL